MKTRLSARRLVRHTVVILGVAALSACATPPPASSKPSAAAAKTMDIGGRANEICALPASEREAAIAKLKRETGLVLYCGQENNGRED